MTTNLRTTLPSKPSALISLALADLYAVERQQNVYEVYMGDWHLPIGTKCSVCFAGAVMAKTLGESPENATSPHSFSSGTCNKLEALDYFRLGSVGEGFECMGRSWMKGQRFQRQIESYSVDSLKFKRQMRRLVRTLRANGY